MKRLLVCVIGIIYCSLNSCSLNWAANSVMHQLYAGLYSLMAVIFLCCFLIIFTLLENKKSAGIEDKKEDSVKKRTK